MDFKKYFTSLAVMFIFILPAWNQCAIEDIDITGLDFPNITCHGDNNVQLTVDFVTTCSGATYAWSHGLPPNQTVNLPIQTSTQTYSVTVTNGMGQMSTASVQVNVNPQLSVGINANPGTICSGMSSSLVAQALGGNGSYSYTWNQGLGSGSSKTVTPLSNTTYEVTVTDGVGCTATANTLVVVNTSPTANINATSTTICAGSGITLTASGGVECDWSSGQDDCIINVSPVGTTTYTVTVTSANLCTATKSQVITVLPPPTANAGSDVTICNGESAILTAQGGTNYMWETGGNTQTITVTPTQTTCYTVTATIGSCDDEDEVCVTVQAAPVANAGPDKSICPGESVELVASGGTSYEWSTGQSGPEIDVSPSTTTIFRVTVTNANGCSDVDDVTVVVNPGPVGTITPNETICEGGAVTLIASGGQTYEWSTGQHQSSIVVAPSETAVFAVTITGPEACDAILETTVTVVGDPEVGIEGGGVVCTGGSRTLNALVSGGFGPTIYQWERSTDQAFWSNFANTQSISLTNLTQTAHFRVRVTQDGVGCNEDLSDVATVNVVTEPHPVISSFTDNHCTNQQVIFFVSNPSSPESIFEWTLPASPVVKSFENFGSSILVHFGDVTGSQTITVKEQIDESDVDCAGSGSLSINIDDSRAPDTTNIIYTPINNILIYNDSLVSCYLWGEIDENGHPVTFDDEVYQSFVVGSDYDKDKEYFVQIWNGDCSQPGCSTIKLAPRSPTVNDPDISKFGLYPNPNLGEFVYEVYPIPEQFYTIIITDVLGRQIEEREIFADGQRINETFLLKDIGDGVHVLSLWSANQKWQVIPFVKSGR